MSWKQVAIGEVAEIVSGGTPKSSVAKYWGGDVAWATPTDLSKLKGKHLVVTERSITGEGLSSCSAKVLPKNSVLFSSRAPIGLVAVNTLPTATNQGFKSFVPSDELDADFLFWWLKANRQRLEDLGAGATFKEVSKRVVSEVQIPLPPIDEQRRIARILDKAEAIRRKREQALELVDEFLKSVFLEMFGDPSTNPKGWQVARIGSGLTNIVAGWSAKGDARPAACDEFGVLKISAVTSGEYRPEQNKAVSGIPKERKLVVPKKGDLLFSRANTQELVAATCIVIDEKDNVFLPDKLWRMDLDSNVFEAPFLKFVLTHKEYRRSICEKATGTSGSMVNISQAKLVDHEIPIPPIKDQKCFSVVWWKTQAALLKQKTALKKSSDLFSSLSQHAFQGKL